ncbi:leucine-rich repeat protein [Arsukibacterium sp.]|uniref:leucine-rich repeat protein n=1 Tax=Arsukibacterium sp. TaxID=1977258 RepID=UPI001BD34391|nr:leucine-rich repeat protein [Arsukibacterium sp.]
MAAFQHPGAFHQARLLIKQALDTGATSLNLSKLRLRQLPKDLVLLADQISSLDLSNCGALTDLSSIEAFTQLTELKVSGCYALQSLDELKFLTKLTKLDVSRCQSLQNLDGMKHNLRHLDISYCRGLQNLGGLQYLTQLNHLDISYCPALQNLDLLQHLTQLTHLALRCCGTLKSLDRLKHLTQLLKLDVSDCGALESLKGLQHLSELTQLEVNASRSLKSLDGVQHLTHLTKLAVCNCHALHSLVELQQLKKLTQLAVSGSDTLESLDGLQYLTQLFKLAVSRCGALKNVEVLQNMTQLTHLNISYSHAVKDLDRLKHLSQLTHLDVSGFFVLNSLDGLQYLTQLTHLDISRCNALKSLERLENLTQLTQLVIRECDALISVDGLKHLTKITHLSVSHCRALNNLEEVRHLTQLTQLDISGAIALKSLDGLQHLTKLTELSINSCHGLTSLDKLQHLTDLSQLAVSGCDALKSLDVFLHMTKLTQLDVSNCQALQSLNGIDHLVHLITLKAEECSIVEIGPLQTLNKEFPYFNKLYLYGNPLQKRYNLQLEKLENSLPILEAFLYQQGSIQSQTPIRLPAKVMLLGNHAAGKTTLLCEIDPNVKYAGSTHILQVHPYAGADQKEERKQKHKLPAAMIYDFGGQDYYHGIYRVFMGQDGICCLVWNKQQDRNHCVPDSNSENNLLFNRVYWLGCIRHFQPTIFSITPDSASNPDVSASELILVQTYIERDDSELTVSSHIYSQHHLSLKAVNKSNENLASANSIDDLNHNLNTSALAYFRAQLNKVIYQHQTTIEQAAWYEAFLARILATHQTKKLSDYYQATETDELLKHYRAPRASLAEHKLLETALTQLHRQGLVLYYPHINSKKVWQNPMAFVEYVHEKVLTKSHLKQSKGIITKELFANEKIDPDVLAILQKEKVIFLHPFGGDDGNQPEYIVPNYLSLINESSPDYQLATFGLLARPALILWFEHFVPLGLINQLVCFFGQMPDRKKFWRDQILFTLEASSKVLIKLEFSPKLQIKVYLQNNDAKQYQQHLSYLYYVLMGLYHDYSVDPLDDYCQNHHELCRQYGHYRELDPLPNKAKPFSPELPWLYRQIYLNPPNDLRLSVNGQYFVKVTDLARLDEQQTTVAAQSSDDAEISVQLPASQFAPFMLNKPKKRLKVFISYSHDDIKQRHVLQKFLSNLIRAEKIEIWHDNMINAGDFWDQTIRQKLAEADVAILLVSQSLLASSYIQDVEAPLLMQLHQQRKLSIVPVLIRECCYEDWLIFPPGSNPDLATFAAELQFLPKNEQAQLQAIQDWHNPEKAWKQVVAALNQLFIQS